MKHTIVRYTLAIIGLFSVTSCTDYLDNAPDDILTLDMVSTSNHQLLQMGKTIGNQI